MLMGWFVVTSTQAFFDFLICVVTSTRVFLLAELSGNKYKFKHGCFWVQQKPRGDLWEQHTEKWRTCLS